MTNQIDKVINELLDRAAVIKHRLEYVPASVPEKYREEMVAPYMVCDWCDYHSSGHEMGYAEYWQMVGERIAYELVLEAYRRGRYNTLEELERDIMSIGSNLDNIPSDADEHDIHQSIGKLTGLETVAKLMEAA